MARQSQPLHHGFRHAAAALLLLVCLAPSAWAINPTLVHILPRGGAAGSEVEVTLTGNNLADAEDLMFHEPGISLVELIPENAKQARAKLAIAPDCPVGLKGIRVRTRTGVSNMELFSVGALAESDEIEPNNLPSEAAAVALGVTVNGVVTNEDVDYYAVELAEGQRLAVEIEGLRLGTALFDPKLRLFSPQGHERIAEDDTILCRQDAAFVYVAQEAGVHHIAVSEAAYGGGGNCFYRLHVGAFPRPMSALPLGAAPGQETQVRWLGDPGMDAQTLAVPAVEPGTRFISVRNEAGVAPSPMPMRISTLPAVLEIEPNNQNEQATPASVPGALDGFIGEPGDVDRFAFEGVKGQRFDVRVWARALGSPLDSVVRILKPSGGALQADDDGAGLDSAARIALPEDGQYILMVRDHLMRGGDTFAYRVEVEAVAPSLNMIVLENDGLAMSVPRGNRALLLINAARRDCGGPVEVRIEGLPEGVEAPPVIVPDGQTRYPILLHAAPEAPLAGALSKLTGTIAGEPPVSGGLDQEVRLVQGKNNTTFYGRQVEHVAIAVSEAAPFSVEIAPPAAPMVHHGSRNLVVRAHRAEGFDAPIHLRFPWLPPGIGGGTAQIPKGEDAAQIALEVRGGAAAAAHQIFVEARSAGWRVCSPQTPLEVQAPWVGFEMAEVETEQGKPVELRVKLNHHQPFEGSFPVVLAGLPKGVTAEPQPITKDTPELVYPLTVAADAATGKSGRIHCRAQITLNGESVLHTGGDGSMKIYKPLPPEMKAQAPPPPPKQEDQPERKTRFPQT